MKMNVMKEKVNDGGLLIEEISTIYLSRFTPRPSSRRIDPRQANR